MTSEHHQLQRLQQQHQPLQQPLQVSALFDFTATHTDELSFRGGDIITVTCMMDGGWWEGSSGGRTGWFPSNYVTRLDALSHLSAQPPQPPPPLLDDRGDNRAGSVGAEIASNRSNQQPSRASRATSQAVECHSVVIQNLAEQERRYCAELYCLSACLQELIDKLLARLAEPFRRLRECVQAMHSVHHGLATAFDAAGRTKIARRMAGRELLTACAAVRQHYLAYHRLLPLVSANLEQSSLNHLFHTCSFTFTLASLRAYLAGPLHTLERYQPLLAELYKYLEEGHPDREATSAAAAALAELSRDCSEARRLKEAEAELLVRGRQPSNWPSDLPPPSSLGQPLVTGVARRFTPDGTFEDRLLLLFSKHLIVLAVGSGGDLRSCSFDTKFHLASIGVARVDAIENAFQVVSAADEDPVYDSSDRQVFVCPSKAWLDKWLSTIQSCQSLPGVDNSAGDAASRGRAGGNGAGVVSYQSFSLPRGAGGSHSLERSHSSAADSGAKLPAARGVGSGGRQHQQQLQHGHHHGNHVASSTAAAGASPYRPVGGGSCGNLQLRPAPPVTPKLAAAIRESPRSSRKLSRKESARLASSDQQQLQQHMLAAQASKEALEDDMLILQVIEAYCVSSRARNTMNLLDLTKIRLSDSELKQKVNSIVMLPDPAGLEHHRISSDSGSSQGSAAQQQQLPAPPPPPPEPPAPPPPPPLNQARGRLGSNNQHRL
ncbi:hypothetical protein BOX15_Mlig007770g1 [Macrostomum lignano]|uniref:SH3 domain-containing protein n=2 Tax=Macrostomum lignano TaxID=282301 RepID=A0A267E2R0_9PLAT|nr:hypothetical protein BOX15_Mlig007770g1 [Macrostomum lignano]